MTLTRSIELVARIIGVSPDQLRETDAMNSIPSWDSKAQLEIIVELESVLDVEIENEAAFGRMTSLIAIEEFWNKTDEQRT